MQRKIHKESWKLLAVLAAAIFGSIPGIAPGQDASAGATPAAAAETGGAPGLEAVQARLAEIEADTGIADAAKASLKKQYEEAIASLQQAQQLATSAAAFKEALVTAPDEIADAREKLAALPAPDQEATLSLGLEEGISAEQLDLRLSKERTSTSSLKAQLLQIEKQIADEESRPSQAIERLPSAQGELATLEESLRKAAGGPSPGLTEEAQGYVRRARKVALQSEVDALEQERLSFEVRQQLLEARRGLLSRQVALAEIRLAAIQEFASRQAKEKVDQAAMLAGRARAIRPGQFPALQELADDLESLSGELRLTAAQIHAVEQETEESEDLLEATRRDFESVRKQIEIGGLEEVFLQILLDNRHRLPGTRAYKRKLKRRKEAVTTARLNAFQVRQAVRNQGEVEKEVAAILAGTAVPAQVQAEISALVEARRDLRSDLGNQYRRLFDALGRLDLTERQYLAVEEEFSGFLGEKLFWVQSSPRLDASAFRDLPASLNWLAGPHRWKELGAAFRSIPFAYYLAFGLLLALLIFPRRQIRRKLRESGERTRRISTDRYQNTSEALLMTLLLVAPGPLALVFFGWQLDRDPEASNWLQGLSAGLLRSVNLLFFLLVAYFISRPKGLAEAHFRWDSEMLGKIRRAVAWLTPVYVTAFVAVTITLHDDSMRHLHSFGRLAFIFTMIWMAMCLGRLFHPRTGILSHLLMEYPDRWEVRFRFLWYFLAILTPLLLAGGTVLGYFVTALTFNYELRLSLAFIGLGAVVYGLLLRWFTIRERKLALEQAIEERDARREAQAEKAKGAETEDFGSEEGVLPEIEKEALDLATVGDQTRRLLRFVVLLGVLGGIWLIWAGTVPALKVLNEINAFGGLSVGELIMGVVVLALTIAAARNLPGLLEVAVLRNLTMDAGSRYATTTLCRYGVVALGLAALFNVMGLDWSKFGWIAAALSVGLGFGLQEVVANFVCGIILLFERPMRVGDWVTIGSVEGVVSRIRMRATTVVNWDRKEFVVPNKEFITGTLLNWTLSNTVTRIVIPVGVAYGTDTVKVHELLLKIAREHDGIMDDPAPLAVFENFGDSTLEFSLRCYLPSTDNRLRMIHDLHTEIHRRFGEEGIEIAFPQRDLHLRSVDPGVGFGDGPRGEDGK